MSIVACLLLGGLAYYLGRSSAPQTPEITVAKTPTPVPAIDLPPPPELDGPACLRRIKEILVSQGLDQATIAALIDPLAPKLI